MNYVNSNRSLEVILFLCSFSRIILVDFCPRTHELFSIKFLNTVAMLGMDFIMEQALNTIEGCLTTSLTFISLLQQYTLQAGHWSKSQDLDLVDTDDYLSLFVALRSP